MTNDQATFVLKNNDELDEIKIFERGRYTSRTKAVWEFQIFKFMICIQLLLILIDVYLENGQHVYFTAKNLNERLANPLVIMILAFF